MLAWCDKRPSTLAAARYVWRCTRSKARFEAMCGAPGASAFSADEAHIEITEHADPAMAEQATSRKIIDAFLIGDPVVRWSS